MVRHGAAALRSAEAADIRPLVAWNHTLFRSPFPPFRRFHLLFSLLRPVCTTRQHTLLPPGPRDFDSFGDCDFWVNLSAEVRAICFIKERRDGPRRDAGCRSGRRLPLHVSSSPSCVGG